MARSTTFDIYNSGTPISPACKIHYVNIGEYGGYFPEMSQVPTTISGNIITATLPPQPSMGEPNVAILYEHNFYLYCATVFGVNTIDIANLTVYDNSIDYLDINDAKVYLHDSRIVDIDSTPTSNSNNPITSGGVYAANYAGSTSSGGPANKTMAIPYGEVANTSTATAFTATVDGITELKDGVCVLLKNGVVTSAAGFTININNLGAKPAFSNMTAATRETTIFNVNYTMLFVYDSTRVVDGITGAWCCYRGYDVNTNTIGYQVRTNSYSLPMSSITYRYRILFTSADGSHFVPANNSTSTNATASRTVCQDKIDPFGKIVYYGTTASVAAGSRPSATNLWLIYAFALGYSFNRTGAALTLTSWKPVYVKCAPQSDGSAIIDSTTPYVQDLPTTDDGKIYIFLGVAYSATNIELLDVHPVYYYADGAIRIWTNAAAGGGTITDVTVGGTSVVSNGVAAVPEVPTNYATLATTTVPNVTSAGSASTWSFALGTGNDEHTLIISGGNGTAPTLGTAKTVATGGLSGVNNPSGVYYKQ